MEAGTLSSPVVVSSDVLHLTQVDVGFAMVLRRVKQGRYRRAAPAASACR